MTYYCFLRLSIYLFILKRIVYLSVCLYTENKTAQLNKLTYK